MSLAAGGGLQGKAINQFDSLKAKGRLFFEETDPETVDSSGYKVQYSGLGIALPNPLTSA